MARETKRKGKSRKGTQDKGRKGTQSDRGVTVELAPTIEFLHKELSESLCQEVFQDLRTGERERKWSLFALARFWLAVVLDPPKSLSQMLERMRSGDPTGFLPDVSASAEAFFQRCKNLSSGFFMALYARFISNVESKAPRRYCQELHHLLENFSTVSLIDGSRLDRIAKRLKILQGENAVILPGCLLAVYDLFRGIATQLWFEADAAASEFKRALVAVECLAPNTLLLGDRLYGTVAMFRALGENGAFGLFRRNKTVSIKKLRRLSRQRLGNGLLEDHIVQAGRKGTEIELRLVTLKTNGKTHEALTNVLDPKRLSAEDVAQLYPQRWQVERLFYDLKVVLNVKKLYAANPNAVAMQIFSAAMVHASFRIAQADIADKLDLVPEELSSEKLFPLLAFTSIKILESEFLFEHTQKANSRVKLRKPSWKRLSGTVVSLRYIRKQVRSEERRPRKFHEDRKKWKSITKVDGAEELT